MEKNLETAADVYISKCNNAPFQESKITLFIRSKDELAKNIQEWRPHQKTFLKGSQKKRQLLKESNQTQYKYFEDIWKLRGRNMVKGLPSNYLFHLLPCYEDGCPHSACRAGKPTEEHCKTFLTVFQKALGSALSLSTNFLLYVLLAPLICEVTRFH